MGKLEETIALIESQGEKYKKHSNEWNVMQQLIDILADDPQSAEIVYEDLQVEEMKLRRRVRVGEIMGGDLDGDGEPDDPALDDEF